MEKDEIIEKIKNIKAEIEEKELEGATAEQLATYLVEVDKLTAMMLASYKNGYNETEDVIIPSDFFLREE